MRCKTGLVVLAVHLLFWGDAYAQRHLYTTYSMKEGLVQNSVRDFFQDSNGFIWIGTWEGLSKYDGNRFINFTTANGLSHSMVNDIIEPTKGAIYITCNDGTLNLIRNGIPHHIPTERIVINNIRAIGNKWIATSDHHGLYEFKNGTLTKPEQAYPDDNYYQIGLFNDSLYIAQSDTSLQLLTMNYELYAIISGPQKLYPETGLLTDSKKRTWVGTVSGLKLLAPNQEKGKPLRFAELPSAFNIPFLKTAWVKDIIEDADGNFWIATLSGLVKISADGSYEIMTEKNGLPASDIDCLFQDREKNIWIGTSRGIAKIVTRAGIKIYNEEAGLKSNNIGFIFPNNDGTLLTGTSLFLQHFDTRNAVFNSLPVDRNYFSDGGPASALSFLREKNLSTNFLVFSSRYPGHIFFSPSSSGAYFAFQDQQGNYFFPSTAGLMFGHEFGKWEQIFFREDCRIMMIDRSNDLWLGTLDSGLVRIRYEYRKDTPHLLSLQRFFPDKGFRALYQDSKGYIWAGTRFNGVYRLDPEDPAQPQLQFDQTSGLTSNRIVSIAEDKQGAIWLNFYNGLDKLLPTTNGYRVFSYSRYNNYFTNIQSLVFDTNHSMWLATTQGLVNIVEEQIDKLGPLPVYITSATMGDSIYHDVDNETVSLNYRNRRVQFEFAAAGFINEKQHRYTYRLVGSNNPQWSNASTDHSVSYANLQPGNYRFEVRNLGWNEEWGPVRSLSFEIRSPFWQTAWFIVAIALLIATILILLVKRRIRLIRKESSLKQKITETEMMALRSQMNPHFIFNCLNAIDNLIQTNQKDKATTYLSRFAKLVRNVLDSSKNNVVPFHKDYESLQLYLQMEQFRCNNRFEYELDADQELLQGDLRVPPLIIQPFVENAIHHGLLNKESNDRKLQISARIEKDHILYRISDNGIGRAKAKELKAINKPEHQSYGIQITEERIHLYNQKHRSADDVTITDLYNNNGHTGTLVMIKLKIADNI